MSVTGWGERLAPDLTATFRRFPLAIAMQTVATVLIVAEANGWISAGDDDNWSRAIAGLIVGAIFAMAGELFSESRPQRRAEGVTLAYAVPLLAAASFQIRDSSNFVPYLLPVVGLFWLSISAFTGTAALDRAGMQDRFWWLNHRAFTSGVLAVAGFVLVSLGCFALQQALLILFGFGIGDIFWRYILPVAGGLLAPLYWMSTIPQLGEYDAKLLHEPDFLSRAIGFLGQFILAPILLAYAAILLAYTAQIVAAQQLPKNLLGWMVLGFVTTGAATWLLLYPPFMRERLVVRLFLRVWFWLTIVPLALLGVAVWTRIFTYGLTAERLVVLGGGLWAALLTLLFLIRRGDIRLIPALAGGILLVLSVGPWNVLNAPRLDQAWRLDGMLGAASVSGKDATPQWVPGSLDATRSTVDFLIADAEGRVQLERVLAAHDIGYDPGTTDGRAVMASLGGGAAAASSPPADVSSTVSRGAGAAPLDLSATPLYLGPVQIYIGSTAEAGGRHIGLLDGNKLDVADDAGNKATIDVGAWVKLQGQGTLEGPGLDFDLGSRHYRVAVESIQLLGPDDGPQRLTDLTGTLFVSAKPSAAAPAEKSPAPAKSKP